MGRFDMIEKVLNPTSNRRKSIRIPLVTDVFSRGANRLIGRSLNIFRDGVFVETNNILEPGTKMLLEFMLPERQNFIIAYGDVKWTTGHQVKKPSGMGIQFIGMYEVFKRKLEEYVVSYEEQINSDNHTLGDFINITDKDLFKKTKPAFGYIKDMKRKGHYTYQQKMLSASRNRVKVLDEKTGKEKEIIMMGSSNYLGLANHPEVVKSSKEAVNKYGMGASSVPLLAGTSDIHSQLEAKLAELTGCEDAIVFPTGYMANLGCISGLIRKQDVVIVDEAIHASVIDGCKLSGSSFRTFKHSNLENLKQVLEDIKDRYSGKLVIVEGVYSMDGDIAPLPQIVEVAHEYGAKVMVDDAHAIGVIGERGRGSASYFNLQGRIDIIMGSLSKTLGSLGGFVASSLEVINYLRYYAKPFFFAVNLPPSIAASVLTAVNIMENEPRLHQTLWKNIKYIKENLKSLGLTVMPSDSSIMSIVVGDELILRKMSKRINEEGVYIDAIPYPAVPKGQARLRLRVTANHTKEDLDTVLGVLEKIGKEFGVLNGPERSCENVLVSG